MSLASRSLEKTLACVMRRGVPEEALAGCAAADRALLENVAHLAQQVVAEVDLTRASVERQNEIYVLTVPWSACDVRVNLGQMKEIEAYSPFRIVDVCVRGGEGACLVVKVGTENRPVQASEVDIVRIKRRRV
jgi:hypothetical protein